VRLAAHVSNGCSSESAR